MLFLRKLRLREVSGLLALIWSLIRSLIFTWFKSTHKWTSELIPKTAVPAVGQGWPLASFQARAPRLCPEALVRHDLHFLERSA